MYYLDREIELTIDFLNKSVYNFHIISSYKIDYINKLVNVELSSYKSRVNFEVDPTNAFVSFLELQDTPNFSSDPYLWILRVLISNDKSPFYRAEIKKDINIERINIPNRGQ